MDTVSVNRGLAFAALLCAVVCCGSEVFAGRPLVVDDAHPVEEGNVQLVWGFIHTVPEKGGRDQQLPAISASYGAYKNLETGLTIQRTDTDLKGESPVRGFQDLHLFSKYKFVEEDEKGYVPAMTFTFDLKIPTANSHEGLTTGRFDEGFLLIATKHFFPAAIDLNLGYTVVGRRKGEALENQFFGGVALRYGINEHWRLVGDIYGLTRPARGENAQGNFQLGVRYHFGEFTMFDTAVGRSLLSSGNRFQVTCGVTWSAPVKF
ncbi:MAG TPA: hypothetical protein VKH64_14510 [Candidatus Binatia bacterium]|nr:hypothetical protein [Candidatus Binatia bacterium]